MNAISKFSSQINQEYNNSNDRDNLKKYIQYCKNHATGGQKNRLNLIITNFEQDFTSKDILTITYSLRWNYVHNGETIITNADLDNHNFSFNETQKLKLVKICYSFLAIVTVNIANTLIAAHN